MTAGAAIDKTLKKLYDNCIELGSNTIVSTNVKKAV